MADYFTYFSVAVRLHGKLAPAWVADTLRTRRTRQQELLDAGDDEAADEIAIDFDFVIEDGHLYLTDDGATGRVDHAARFLQELMKLSYVQDPVAIQWAETCSRSRPDAFTGGGVIITKHKMTWLAVPDLIEKKLQQLERRRRRA